MWSTTEPYPPEPWASFLRELDAQLAHPASLHLLGGFVVIHLYKVNRATEDLDAVDIVPGDEVRHMLALAGRDSPLQKKHRVYLDYVRVATYPQDYEARLVPMYHGAFEHLELLALDPYDVVLCKIERNSPKDRYDVEALGVSIPLNTASLRERYERELRPNLLNPSPCDLTSNSGSR